MNSIVTCRDVSFELPNGRLLFQNLNFSLELKLTALVGPNGIGKTCLAKLLAGEMSPTAGAIRRQGSLTFFPQRLPAEAITVDHYLAFDYIWSELGEELLKGIDRQSLCTTLSGGQWMRVRLTKALNDQFLILDEPTNDLDREGREALLHFLRKSENGALLISHDRECLHLCEDVLELSNRGLSKFGGGWLAYEEAKELERSNLKANLNRATRERDAAYQDRTDQREKQEKRNRRGAESAARGGIPKILLGARKHRAQSTTGKVDAETLDRANQSAAEAYLAFSELKIDPVMYADLAGLEIPNQKLVAEAHGFNIRFSDWLYQEDLNFSWRGNIRLALKGTNGSGKSTLVKALLGQQFESRGELRSGHLESLYLDQSCALLEDSLSVLENVQATASTDESEIRNGLAKFLFTKEKVFQKVGSLSGGERLRAALAKSLLGTVRPELLILDEPTNNLDLANIEFLENLLRQFRGALILISHDEVFLQNCGIQEELRVLGKSR
jgi:ATPase subunit of ABC transporter with duplicated ATPase domains